MQKIRRITLLLTTVTVLITFLTNIPARTMGASMPWDPYRKYLPDEVPTVRRHLRGLWIATVQNLDWPTREARDLKDPAKRIEKCKEELLAILDKAVELNMNAVFFQVSPEGDAFYKSEIVPWSRYLTGTFGKDPGFDPLEFAVKAAHERNLEIHAWFNPYRVSMGITAAVKSSLNIKLSVYREHPEWIRTANGRFVVDPGIPEARKWVADRVMEVVRKYDIDGVHFDDYFYTEARGERMNDEETFRKYNDGMFANLGDWRRNNNYLLIKDISGKIRAEKPWVKFGVSPSGVWGNIKDGHPDGSNTNTDYTNYEKCFADTKKWVEEELIDYIAPQIYFTFANGNAPYGELATWWSGVCEGKDVHLYIGQAFYKINADNDPYFKGANAVPELSRQLTLNMTYPGIDGTILFRADFLYDELKQPAVSAIKNNLWAEKALIPVMPWKGGKAPGTPSQGRMRRGSGGTVLNWFDNDPNTTYFAIYRFKQGEKADIASDSSPGKLIATVRKINHGTQEFVDTETSPGTGYFYVITALDRLHNQGGGLRISESYSRYFTDVSSAYSWAAEAIDALYERGIVTGNGDGSFGPGDNIKRGELIFIIVRAFNLWREFTSNFSDVPESSYHYRAIGAAKELGIALGSSGRFYPESYITREDAIVILARTLKAAGKELETAGEEHLKQFLDEALISPYAREAVAAFTRAKIVLGSAGRINPKNNVTRAEITLMLYRLLAG
jgi:uncharacterized lipoprotein YddW (UPF0748 family)